MTDGVQPTRPPSLPIRPGVSAWQSYGWWVSARAFARKYYEVPRDFENEDLLPVDTKPHRWRSA